MKDGVIARTHSIRRRGGRRKVETSTPYKEVTDRKLRQYVKLLPVTFAAQIAFAALIFATLLQIDQLVHTTLYSYGLQFSNTWALPYWTFNRFALGMLLLIMSLSALLIVNILRSWRNR